MPGYFVHVPGICFDIILTKKIKWLGIDFYPKNYGTKSTVPLVANNLLCATKGTYEMTSI